VRFVLGIAEEQLKAFVELGGEVLFGTDVGYMTEYDPRDEYAYMRDAGLSYAQILASLTTAPSRRFGAARAGRLVRGNDADVVVVNGAPERDIRARADVRYTIRAGRIIYRKT
jgi:imidazolonepropionase-like amidohydrolase